jgi:hypothetical protein
MLAYSICHSILVIGSSPELPTSSLPPDLQWGRRTTRARPEIPGFRDRVWGLYRHAISFADYHYYSQGPRGYVEGNGRQWLARYRLIPVNSVMSKAAVEELRFSRSVAPADLGTVLATSPYENAYE